MVAKAETTKDVFGEIPVSAIRPGKYQPRTFFDQDALEELANSIREEGLAQPILVRPLAEEEDGIQYEIIAGERRWRAFRLLGKKTIPAFSRKASDRNAALIGLIENIQRESLTVVEEARSYKKMIDELKLTQQEISDKVGKSRPVIANTLRLLSLHPDVLMLLESKQLETAAARALVVLPKNQQPELAEQIVKKGMSSKAVEAAVKKVIKGSVEKEEGEEDSPKEHETPDENAKLQENIQSNLPEGIKVDVRVKKDGSGTLKFDVPAEQWEQFLAQFME